MLDLATATFAMPVWAVALIIALFAVAAVFAFVQTGANEVLRPLVRAGTVFVGAVLVVWIFLDRTAEHDRQAERRALDARVNDLAVRAVAPGSPLACLDAIAGDSVEAACEQALFASPETVAAAVTYVSARLNLLAQSLEFAGRGDRSHGPALLALRQSLESDRYGIVAQVLSLRDSCTPAQCDSFALLHDTTRVRANLRDRAFDSYVVRYAANWSGRAGTPVADAAPATAAGYPTLSGPAMTGTVSPSPAVGGVAAAPAKPAAVSSRYDFPSASSIPPVSIMTPEPDTPPARTPAAGAAAAPAQRKPAAPAPARAAAAPLRTTPQGVSAPVPLAPTSLPPATEAGPSLQ